MKSTIALLIALSFIVGLLVPNEIQAGQTAFHAKALARDTVKLENPISVKYLKTKLRNTAPRLVLTPAIEKNLKKKNQTIVNLYQ